jgi:hypothetical protein
MQIVILLPLVFFSTTFGGNNKEVDCADNFPAVCLFWGDLENGQGNRKGNEEILDNFFLFCRHGCIMDYAMPNRIHLANSNV